jgi:hypothetical protein
MTVAALGATTFLTPVISGDVPTADATTRTVSARTLLRDLDVKSETNAGYDRNKLRHWVDTADADVCNARYEVLIAEAVTKPRVTSSCRLYGGKWRSKYDGKTTTDPSTFDVDHVVALAEAWGSGAKRWTAGTRQRFANDLRYGASLIAVSASSNRSKSDREPGQWMPPTTSYRCTYVKRWIAVKWRWDLAVNTAEKSSLSAALTQYCGTTRLNVAKPGRASIALAGSTTSPGADAPWNQPGPDLDCSDIGKKVRVYAPDYHNLDSDGDGWGCESYA